VLAWTVAALAAHAVLPLELSRLGGRAERRGRTRPLARSAGLLTIAAGGALMLWALAAHYEAAPQGWTLESRPTRLLRTPPYRMEYLLRKGPYGMIRNPIYAGEAVVWLGWALFYGRPAVWTGLAIVCAGLATIVPWEERLLLERFGDDYRAYLAEVPRWVPRIDPGPARQRGITRT